MRPGSAPTLAALASALLLVGPANGATIADPGQGPVDLPAGMTGAEELSGLAHAGGDQFYAVSDNGGQLFPVQIQVDATSGFVTSAVLGAALSLAGGVDLEGVVYDASTDTVLVSDETGPAVREHRLSDGALLGSLILPTIFAQIRSNLSLESLSLDDGGDWLWTANEEALLVDGPISTLVAGTTVRLQRFDALGAADGQWAYVTDPIPDGPFFGQERSGVSDLLALPGGELLVLERSLGVNFFRSSIYEVDFAGASDTSALASLDTDPFTPVAKTLLWEATGLAENFEGIALGPSLAAGDWSLLLVSDDSGGLTPQRLWALRIQFVPEPSAELQLAAGIATLALLGWSRATTAAAGPRSNRPSRPSVPVRSA